MIAEMVSVVDTTSVGLEVRVFIIMICKHIDNFCALSEKKKNLLKFSVIHRKDYCYLKWSSQLLKSLSEYLKEMPEHHETIFEDFGILPVQCMMLSLI